ncbi:alpha/beta fold hydrolase [Actinomadura flavalba]|uniref:alpha/beta fold hydrolase n=1 Tax=Actinomadura flavalba TaxID=1120938 RepID=UPI0003649328|nr:alpha/beta hydrolase [Actinomadura flavalba]
MTTTAKDTRVEGTVTSADGTAIAYERQGSGPPVLLVASALADRRDARKLAGLLAEHHTVINYDRRGRGASGDGPAYAVEREIEDIAALNAAAGGGAALFGSSSGAVLALRAAASGLDVSRVAVYEPPFVVGDANGFGPPDGFAARIDALLAADRRGDAVRAFMREAQGMPAFLVASMRLMPGTWAGLKRLAPTLPYDLAVMDGTQRGGPFAPQPWSRITAPTLVLTGGKSPAGFHAAAEALTAAVPSAEHRTLPGLNHGAVMMAPKRLAPTLTDFLN